MLSQKCCRSTYQDYKKGEIININIIIFNKYCVNQSSEIKISPNLSNPTQRFTEPKYKAIIYHPRVCSENLKNATTRHTIEKAVNKANEEIGP